MALPNPTKTNYGTVDDITPVEMNDIGSNLISLGQKILKVVNDTWILTNADHDGTNFIRIDIAKAASALQLGIDGSKTAWNAAAGANPIVWVQGEKWDASGKLVSGAIQESSLFERMFADSAGSSTPPSITFPIVNIGDLIGVSATMSSFQGTGQSFIDFRAAEQVASTGAFTALHFPFSIFYGLGSTGTQHTVHGQYLCTAAGSLVLKSAIDAGASSFPKYFGLTGMRYFA